jgi:threonine dehydrogenase-like Zn-dependent dehydrogenase
MGHEYVGIVEEVGREVRTIKPGQFVIGSFFASDNTCPICQAGYQSRCLHSQYVGAGGAQAERLRVPLADGTLVATPDIPSDDLVPSLLAASDVLGTGWFGAVAADVKPGKTVVVIGDSAVGLLAVLASKQLGAERIIAMSRHAKRQQLAREFGATDIVTERGEAGVEKIKELTDGLRAHSVIVAVGSQESMLQAIRPTRSGGAVGYVGVSHGVQLDGGALNTQIDAAYQSKYHTYSATYVDPMIAPQARATTLKLVPSALQNQGKEEQQARFKQGKE